MITAQTTQKPKPKPKKPSYPCIKQSRHTDRIILFLKPDHGLELVPPLHGLPSCGTEPREFEESACDLYEGAVTISNA